MTRSLMLQEKLPIAVQFSLTGLEWIFHSLHPSIKLGNAKSSLFYFVTELWS